MTTCCRACPAWSSGDAPLVVRVVAGPHGERFVPDVLARLAGRRFRVGETSNRVGLRLETIEADGAQGDLATHAPAELDSQGVVTGAVQIPPGGEPVVLGPDHATLGGYPVAAVVASVDHALLGQCAPGQRGAHRAGRARRGAPGLADMASPARRRGAGPLPGGCGLRAFRPAA